MPTRSISVLAFVLLSACGDNNPPTTPATAVTSNPITMEQSSMPSIYVAAVEHPDRTENDRSRDAGRNPAAVLEFFGIEPGMDVLDMFSGGGYYTEILARVVGNDGTVTAHSNEAYAQFVGDEAISRYGNDRLSNVELFMAENGALVFPDNAYDAVMMVLAYHDIYYVSPNNGWPRINGPKLLEELFDALRPGGILAIVDHYAAAGSGRETGNTLHRIDAQIVITEVEMAGFELEAKSDVLRNMDDDHSLNMSAPEIRGKTDRFVLRFVKPRLFKIRWR